MPTNLGNLPSNAAIPASGLADNVLPLGTVIDWYRAATSTSVPTGWVVCDGSNWVGIDNHMGVAGAALTTGAIPNLIGKFTMGARPTTTAGGVTAADTTASSNGNAYANAPGIGGTGGSNAAIDLAHTHTVAGHAHGFSLSATAANASFSVDTGGTNISFSAEAPGTSGASANHTHAFSADQQYANNYAISYLTSSSGSYARVTTLYFGTPSGTTGGHSTDHSHSVNNHGHGFNNPGHGHGITQTAHGHAVTGTVGTAGTSGDSAITTGGLSWTAAVTDLRPAHVGLLKIMKVKII